LKINNLPDIIEPHIFWPCLCNTTVKHLTMKTVLFALPVALLMLLTSCEECTECSLSEYCFTATSNGGAPQEFCYNTRGEADNSHSTLQSFGATVSSVEVNVQSTDEFCDGSGDLIEGYRLGKESDGFECN
jgi:hypothetical protein